MGIPLRLASTSRGALKRRGEGLWICLRCQQKRYKGTASEPTAGSLKINEKVYQIDDWMNTPSTILSSVNRQLHNKPDHPLTITRKLIESRFPGFKSYNTLFPVVTTAQNFDSLGFPPDHPGRNRTDTYYINKTTVLRTHTSAHQSDVFRANESDGFTISADVYRRDAIDRTHYPIFHQMEGAMTWDRNTTQPFAERVWKDVDSLPKHDIEVSDPNPTIHAERNPLQPPHTAEEVMAMAAHLKRSLENVVVEIFAQAKQAAITRGDTSEQSQEPLKVRWVEAYFPFTSPSWELEVYWQGDWLEVLGCGIVQQDLLSNSGVPARSGWAFGLGLERIAMLLFSIPDIRLFWSQDQRFLSQFTEGSPIKRFTPFSNKPGTSKDVSFWLSSTSSAAGGGTAKEFHENDFMELVRQVAGDLVEDVRLTDTFTHPKTGRKSLCYRVNYRSLERTLTHEEANGLHEEIRKTLVDGFGVELR